ncbi:MAG TPA: hypothetical protein VK832_13550, partial [Burkholderiaceae bacterium]|nr:hypothetical protein [Burkholderiaceae bacterium]
SKKHLKLKNPLSVEQAYLRSSLLPNHMSVLQANRMYAKDMAFYEISRIFIMRESGAELPDEPEMLGITMQFEDNALARGKGLVEALAQSLGIEFDVKSAESANYARGRLANIMVDGVPVGTIGQVNPALNRRFKISSDVVHIELSVEQLLAEARPRQFKPVHRFPIIERDITVTVPTATSWRSVVEALEAYAIVYLGEYQGGNVPKGSKNLSFRVIVSEPTRTPTEEEATRAEDRVKSLLARKFPEKVKE